MKILVTDAVPEEVFGVPFSARQATVGLTFTADDVAVERVRQDYPCIPKLPNTYEVAYSHFHHVLGHAGRYEALTEWNLYPHRIVQIPHRCARVVAD
jgi:hypothetical protein